MPIRAALKSQYRSALSMLRQTITQCPDDLWLDPSFTNRYWHIAYHTLFFTHVYLQHRIDDWKPWHMGREHLENLGKPTDPPYCKADLLAFADFIESQLDHQIDTMNLDAPDSGFHWYPIPKLEHQLVNLRHLQHHTAQLADRLRIHANIATIWRG